MFPLRIYFLGIGGIGMGGLAIAMKSRGHVVSGADRAAVYDPMARLLSEAQISYGVGWDPKHMTAFAPEFVVVGNICKADNPLVQWTVAHHIPYAHLASCVQEWVAGMPLVVVAGTHGKTSTAMLIRDGCHAAGMSVSSFIGGYGTTSGLGVRILEHPNLWVVEGDEYDCAFYDKQPKLMYFRGQVAILNACEHDHVDIYPTVEAMLLAYQRWISVLPAGGDFWVHASVVRGPFWEQWLQPSIPAHTHLFTYGSDSGCDVWYRVSQGGQVAIFHKDQGSILHHHPRVIPNAGFCQSLAVMVGVGLRLGLDCKSIADGINAFGGVFRRFHVLRDDGITVVDDFAHHPTAVRMNIEALWARYPGRRICVVFEPRSATSRRNIFFDHWKEALSLADVSVIAPVFRGSATVDPDQLDISRLCADIEDGGKVCVGAKSPEELRRYIYDLVQPNDVWVIFSNGHLQGVVEVLLHHPVSAPMLSV